jgi:hypothetical protein
VLLQHPLGVLHSPAGLVYVADSYNHKVSFVLIYHFNRVYSDLEHVLLINRFYREVTAIDTKVSNIQY